MDGHDHLAGRRQAVDREQPQRGRAVDQHVVVVVPHRIQGPAQAHLAAECRDQLDLGAGKVEGGRGHEEVPDRRPLDAVLEWKVIQDDVVHRGLQVRMLMPSPVLALPCGSRSTTSTR